MGGPAYVWGQWRFEPTECRLTRDGTIVPLPAKTLDLLATLLRRAPRLLTKEEILAKVWPNAAVEEGNIAFHVAALRKVLDQDDGPSAIETVRGRGYRFALEIAIHQLPATDDVRSIMTTPAQPQLPPPILPPTSSGVPGSRRAYRAILLAAIVVFGSIAAFVWWRTQSAPMSIAVQHFEIVNPVAGQENFPDGLNTYLTSKLHLAGVTVAPRDAADALLSGQLHPAVNGFRVNVQLTGVRDGARLWDWSFDVTANEDRPADAPDDERSRVQGLIAARIAEGLRNYLRVNAASVTR